MHPLVPLEGAEPVPLVIPMFDKSVLPFAVVPVPPLSTGRAPEVLPRPRELRNAAADVTE